MLTIINYKKLCLMFKSQNLRKISNVKLQFYKIVSHKLYQTIDWPPNCNHIVNAVLIFVSLRSSCTNEINSRFFPSRRNFGVTNRRETFRSYGNPCYAGYIFVNASTAMMNYKLFLLCLKIALRAIRLLWIQLDNFYAVHSFSREMCQNLSTLSCLYFRQLWAPSTPRRRNLEAHRKRVNCFPSTLRQTVI